MQENLKVYELAKELGIDSISLVGKLKTLEIKVKSHMSSLTPEDVSIARTALTKSEKPTSAKKTKTVKRKTSSTATTGTTTTKKRVTKKKTASSETKTKKKTATAKAASVIRRRAKSEDEAAAIENVAPQAAEELAQAQTTATESTPAVEELSHAEIPATQEGVDTAASAAEMAQEEVASQEQVAESAPKAQKETKKAAQTKDAASDQAQAEPKKSFLNIVKTAPRPKVDRSATRRPPVQPKKTGAAAQADGSEPGGQKKIIKMNKEVLDRMVEEEAAKKKNTTGKGQGPRPEDMKFSDYQKKTIFFVPRKKKIPVGKDLNKTQITTPKAQKRIIEINETISVGDFAKELGVKANQVIKKLMEMGQMATINQALDLETATLVATEYKYEVRNKAFDENTLLEQPDVEEDEAKLVSRPPIVTVMGHVDHGKTSLLDAIKDSSVAAKEAGGITQHIGAYTIQQDGKDITFIDTPGHEAFSVMRARGANVTDIAIIVVAADDGAMPQTREAISHAKAAGVPIIVAINKIDKPDANPEKIKQELSELDLLPEDWGGDTMYIPVSATEKTNISDLLEAINLNAEMLELKANSTAQASGTVLEAKVEKGKGPVVSVILKRGTLSIGDSIVAGTFCGKVKAMINHLGKRVKELKPGHAAELLGFEGVPKSGDPFDSPKTEADAKKVVENRILKEREQAASQKKVTLEDLFAKVQTGEVKELKAVLKADVFGSVEAIRDSIQKLSNDKVKVNVIHAAAGGITETDVLLASASDAIIIGFNIRPETKARQLAEQEKIDVKCYQIIYELIDDVKKAMGGLLEKKKVEKFLGRAEVRQVFSIPKIGAIAGSSVIDGKILRGANVRLLRENVVIYEGKMNSLKRFKDDAKEVSSGYECGIGIENYNDIKAGDVIEAFEIELIEQTLD